MWPKAYGGQGLTGAEQMAWSQESRDYDLPNGAFFIGLSMPGNHAARTAAPRSRRSATSRRCCAAMEIWCQLFSEPGAGSDVASLQTTAVRDGDGWVMNGQKVWTSGAQFSDYGAILAGQTHPSQAQRHQHVHRRHARTGRHCPAAEGGHRALRRFNEVFFDNVRIPADALIGEENKGWDAAVVMLRHERIAIGMVASIAYQPARL